MFLDIFYCLDFSCLSISRSYLLSGLLYQIYTHLSDFFLLLSYIHIIYFIYSFFQLPVICFFLTTLRIPSFLCLLALSSSSFLTLAEIISKCLQVVRRRRHRISFFFLISPLYSHLPFHIRRFSSGTACGRVDLDPSQSEAEEGAGAVTYSYFSVEVRLSDMPPTRLSHSENMKHELHGRVNSIFSMLCNEDVDYLIGLMYESLQHKPEI